MSRIHAFRIRASMPRECLRRILAVATLAAGFLGCTTYEYVIEAPVRKPQDPDPVRRCENERPLQLQPAVAYKEKEPPLTSHERVTTSAGIVHYSHFFCPPGVPLDQKCPDRAPRPVAQHTVYGIVAYRDGRKLNVRETLDALGSRPGVESHTAYLDNTLYAKKAATTWAPLAFGIAGAGAVGVGIARNEKDATNAVLLPGGAGAILAALTLYLVFTEERDANHLYEIMFPHKYVVRCTGRSKHCHSRRKTLPSGLLTEQELLLDVESYNQAVTDACRR